VESCQIKWCLGRVRSQVVWNCIDKRDVKSSKKGASIEMSCAVKVRCREEKVGYRKEAFR